MLLYQLMILEESNQVQKAFDFIKEYKSQMVDTLAVKETEGNNNYSDRVEQYLHFFQTPQMIHKGFLDLIILSCYIVSARLFLKLNRNEEALTLYQELLMRNSENWAYYTGVENASQPCNYINICVCVDQTLICDM